jgi:valyl-tRNA synthetase
MKRTSNIDLTEKHYDPSKVEASIYKLWETHDVFVADNTSKKKPFTIVIPPPNVTGRLHMGHALNNTLQDVLIRYKRMEGFDALWIPGTDHAGIATQTIVKKHLEAEGINYTEYGRDNVIERIWQWKQKYGDHILNQLRRLGCSCDWSRTRFTMDDNLSLAVRTCFKKLYDQGLIYRGKYIVNWCPIDRTALSDVEIDTKDGGEPGHFWYFKYPLKDGSGHIEIATTRPETMLGDTAVAVNPKDARYKDFIGKLLTLPLVGRDIPVIADDYVDPEFGTGCVKITPAHDPNDFQMGLRHNLEQINIMHEDATMNENVPEKYQGMDRYVCRKAVVNELTELGLVTKIEERNVPLGRRYRSKAVIEYRLSDQWFVKMQPLAEKALQASQAGELKFVPERWDNYYRTWLNKTRDWCISRQIWWGHRIPAWHNKETGEVLVEIETPKQVEQNPDAWQQDEDVLDTWFSSALWPYSTLGWPKDTKDVSRYYPTDVLVTGKDIIFFWIARMVMTGLFNLEKAPFHTVLINPIICDEDGETMSKSKGNGIDPLHIIDGASLEDLEEPVQEAQPGNKDALLKRLRTRFPEGFKGVGADALRYTMLTSATDAQQLNISLKKFDEIGRPLADKIWNASKLVLGLLEQCPESSATQSDIEEQWILGRLDSTSNKVREAFDTYSFHHATEALYHFFWDDLCDWYLEIAKLHMKNGSDGKKRLVCETLVEALAGFLKLAHPIMPFITEEMWGHLHSHIEKLTPSSSPRGESILALAQFPNSKERSDKATDESFTVIQDIVRTTRNMRANGGISPKVAIEVAAVPNDEATKKAILASHALISSLANLQSLNVTEHAPERFSVVVLPSLRLCLNMAEHIDVEAEIARNKKALEKIDGVITALTKKLENETFVSKAPADVVEKEREKLSEATNQREKILSTLGELSQG